MTHYVEDLAHQLRCDVVKVLAAAQSGHLGGCLSSADILATLFGGQWVKKQKIGQRTVYPFVLSVGHLAPLLYSVLARMGEFQIDEQYTLRRLGSRLQGHPALGNKDTHTTPPGLFCGSGSLGQGLSIAAGLAIAYPQIKVYALLGDGELQEGQIWEAAMFAAHNKIQNLIAIVDLNGQQLDGSTSEVLALTDLPAKWNAFGWDVAQVNGHSCTDINAALTSFVDNNKPKILLAKTRMGCGIPQIEDQSTWHGKTPSPEQLDNFLTALNDSYTAQKQNSRLPLPNNRTVNLNTL